MKILITGADGQLGRELQHRLPDDWQLFALNRTDLDITDSAAVNSVFQRYQPDLVVNAAAYTAVDKAEGDNEKAFAVNGEGAENIAGAAADFRVRLIHISTDFIFDGTKSRPYQPDDKPNPISVYGLSKFEGEKAVLRKSLDRAIILRSGWIYSSHGSNFVKTMLKLMKERDEISVVADQVGTPTWAGDFARAVYKLAEKKNINGIYHWSDAGVASWYDFAVAIQDEARQMGILTKPAAVKPIRTEDYPTPAKRPQYSVLDKTETWKTLGYTARHWRQALRSMLEEVKKVRS